MHGDDTTFKSQAHTWTWCLSQHVKLETAKTSLKRQWDSQLTLSETSKQCLKLWSITSARTSIIRLWQLGSYSTAPQKRMSWIPRMTNGHRSGLLPNNIFNLWNCRAPHSFGKAIDSLKTQESNVTWHQGFPASAKDPKTQQHKFLDWSWWYLVRTEHSLLALCHTVKQHCVPFATWQSPFLKLPLSFGCRILRKSRLCEADWHHACSFFCGLETTCIFWFTIICMHGNPSHSFRLIQCFTLFIITALLLIFQVGCMVSILGFGDNLCRLFAGSPQSSRKQKVWREPPCAQKSLNVSSCPMTPIIPFINHCFPFMCGSSACKKPITYLASSVETNISPGCFNREPSPPSHHVTVVVLMAYP